MSRLCGVRKIWFKDKIDWTQERGSVLYRTRPCPDTVPEHFLSHVEFFSSYDFPHETHYVFTPLVGIIELTTQQVLCHTLNDDPRWRTFHFVNECQEDPHYLIGKNRRLHLSHCVSNSLKDRFGEVAPQFSEEQLRYPLALNQVQNILYHQEHPNTVFLCSWITVDRNYLLCEPEIKELQWFKLNEIAILGFERPDQFETISLTHISCPARID